MLVGHNSGKSASLHFNSNAGKVFANLSVQIGGLSVPPQVSPPPYNPSVRRNGPSQVRRQQRRAEARRTFAEDAKKELSTEEVYVLKEAENAENGKASNCCIELNKEAENVFQEVADEICSNDVYDKDNHETEEVDTDELARDKNVEKVIVYAVTEPIEKKSDVEAEIREKFANIGVEVREMKTKSTYRGEFDKSLVDISQVNLKLIWGRRLGLKNCSVIAYEG